jgi:hypothetical protein
MPSFLLDRLGKQERIRKKSFRIRNIDKRPLIFLSCGLLFLNFLFLFFVLQVQIRFGRRSPSDIHMDIAGASQSPSNGRGAPSPCSTPQKPAPTYQEFHSSKRQERQKVATVNQFIVN